MQVPGSKDFSRHGHAIARRVKAIEQVVIQAHGGVEDTFKRREGRRDRSEQLGDARNRRRPRPPP